MNDNDMTSARGDQKVRAGGTYITYGVGVDSHVRSLWVLTGKSHMILADTTVNALSLAPRGATDKAAWLEANLDRFPEFMLSTFGLNDHFDDQDQPWDDNGDLWFTAYVDSYTSDLTEKQAFDLVVSETKLAEVKERAPYLGYLYREYLSGLWASGAGDLGTEAPTEEIEHVLRSSLAANSLDMIGFDAWARELAADHEQALTKILTAATAHPAYAEFEGLDLADDSDDLDTVNELAYAILRDTLTRLGYPLAS